MKNIYFTNNNNLIISANYQEENITESSLANRILLLNSKTKIATSVINNTQAINAIDFNSDSNRLAFIDDKTNISIYHLGIDNSFKKLQQITVYDHNAVDLSINYDSSVLAVAYTNNSFIFYDINKSMSPITSKATKYINITNLDFSPNKNFFVIQGRYLRPGSLLNSNGILFNVSDYSYPQEIGSFSSVSIRGKVILSPIKQLIVTYGYSKTTWPNIIAYNWQNIASIKWNRVYSNREKIRGVTIDKHQNILAIMREDNYAYLLAMNTAKDYEIDYIYFFTNYYPGIKLLIDKAHSLIFNTKTTKLAVLSDNNLQIYALRIPEKIKLPWWAICTATSIRPNTATPIPTSAVSSITHTNNHSLATVLAVINNFSLFITTVLLSQNNF